MAISFIASADSTDSAAATSLACNVPTGTTDGDLMFMFIKRGTSGDPTITGWTLGQSNAPGSSTSHWVYYRTASSEPASYTPDWGASSSRTGVSIYTYRGVSSIDAWSDTAYTTNDTTLRAAAFTVGGTGYTIVLFGGNHVSSSVVVTTGATNPGTFTERANNWTSASRFTRYVADYSWSSSGSTGNIDATLGTAGIDKHMFAVSLVPSGGGGTAVPVFVHQLKQQGIF